MITLDKHFKFLEDEFNKDILINGIQAKGMLTDCSSSAAYFRDKELISSTPFGTGSIIDFQDKKWIVFTSVEIKNNYFKGRIRRADWDVNYYASNLGSGEKAITTLPSFFEDNFSASLSTDAVIIPVSNMTVWTVSNNVTDNLEVKDRFIKFGCAWEIQGIDKSKPGLVVINMTRALFRSGDDLINEWPAGANPPEDTNVYKIIIKNQKTTLKVGESIFIDYDCYQNNTLITSWKDKVEYELNSFGGGAKLEVQYINGSRYLVLRGTVPGIVSVSLSYKNETVYKEFVVTENPDVDPDLREIIDPILEKATSTTIELELIEGAEYSINNGYSWQKSNIFIGLSPDTEYTFVQRYYATTELPAGKISNSVKFRTLYDPDIELREIEDPQLNVATNISIALKEVVGAEYSIDMGINWQRSPVFEGLNPDTEYTFIQRYYAIGDIPAGKISNPISFRTLDNPDIELREIEDPKLQSATTTSIILKPITGAEYSINNGYSWQKSNIFSGLEPNTVYLFVQRYYATNELPAGKISNSVIFKTEASTNLRPIVAPELESATDTSITLKKIEGAEYSISSGSVWQRSNIFNNLYPDTEYLFIQRYYATSDLPTGETSVSAIFKTLPDPDIEPTPRPIVAPQLEYATSNSITLKKIEGAEYSINSGADWQKYNTFADLESDTEYTFVQRYFETDTEIAGEVSIPASFKTLPSSESGLREIVDPALEKASPTTIILKPITGAEYSINSGDTWQLSNSFVGLNPDTEYAFVQRYYAIEGIPAGKMSNLVTFRTEPYTGPNPDLREIYDPELSYATTTIIVLKPLKGAEYSIDNGLTWQKTSVFENLSPNKPYSFIQRYYATIDLPAGKISNSVIFKTPETGIYYPPSEGTTGEKITSPKAHEITDTKIILEYVYGAEYSINGGKWQSSTIFEGLVPDTSYAFTQRYAANVGGYPGEISDIVIIRTKKTEIEPEYRTIINPIIKDATSTSISLYLIDGAEYSINSGETWQRSNIFNNLQSDTEYTFVQRYYAINEYPPGVISQSETFKTRPSYEPNYRPIVDPKLNDSTYYSLSLVVVPGAEYSIDGGMTWSTTAVFSSLEPDTEYAFVQRYFETDSEEAGKMSNFVVFKTEPYRGEEKPEQMMNFVDLFYTLPDVIEVGACVPYSFIVYENGNVSDVVPEYKTWSWPPLETYYPYVEPYENEEGEIIPEEQGEVYIACPEFTLENKTFATIWGVKPGKVKITPYRFSSWLNNPDSNNVDTRLPLGPSRIFTIVPAPPNKYKIEILNSQTGVIINKTMNVLFNCYENGVKTEKWKDRVKFSVNTLTPNKWPGEMLFYYQKYGGLNPGRRQVTYRARGSRSCKLEIVAEYGGSYVRKELVIV